MTFGDAIEALKAGKKVARQGWDGKGMFLWLKPGTEIKSEWCKDPELKKLADDNGGIIAGLPTICMYTHDSTGRKAILTGWLASQSDMLLEDWFIVEEKKKTMRKLKRKRIDRLNKSFALLGKMIFAELLNDNTR
jgi:hypothetical protein